MFINYFLGDAVNRIKISTVLFLLILLMSKSAFSQTNPAGTTINSTLWQNSSVLVNDGTIATSGQRGIGNFYGGTTTNNGTITTYNNHGIETETAASIYNNGTITTFGIANAIGAGSSSGGNSLVNTGTITSNDNTVALRNTTYVNNSGTISTDSASHSALFLGGATNFNFTNSGTISSAGNAVTSWTGDPAAMGTLTNTGTIQAGIGYYGINYVGSINTIINSQGVGNAAGALTLYGQMPQNYNVIINSPTNYGQLAITDPNTTSFNFGIDSSSTVANGTYNDVLQGLSSIDNVTGASGTFGASNYQLVFDVTKGSANDWNLVITSNAGVAPEMNASLIPQVGLLLGCLFFMFGRKKQNSDSQLRTLMT